MTLLFKQGELSAGTIYKQSLERPQENVIMVYYGLDCKLIKIPRILFQKIILFPFLFFSGVQNDVHIKSSRCPKLDGYAIANFGLRVEREVVKMIHYTKVV